MNRKIIIEKIGSDIQPTGEYLSREDGSIFNYFIFDKDKTKAIRFDNEAMAEIKQFEMQRRRGLSSKQVVLDCDHIYTLGLEDFDMISGLLNKVNAVTAYWRHNQMVPPKKLDELANRQIEFEEHFKLKGIKV